MFIVPEGHWAIRESFGKFQGILEPGIHKYIPYFEGTKDLSSWGATANKRGFLIEQSEQQTNTPTRNCQTKDNVTLVANTSIGWKIIDPKKAAYAIDHLPTAISDLALNALRANVGTLNFDEVFSSKNILNQTIKSELHDIVAQWGIELIRVEIQELTYSKEVEKAMIEQMAADRKRKALLSLAEGQSESTLMNANAKAEALLIGANAQAAALHIQTAAETAYLHALIKEVGESAAANILIAQKNRESIERITENPSHKVFLPSQISPSLTTNITESS